MVHIRDKKGRFVQGAFKSKDNYNWSGGKIISKCRFCKKEILIYPNRIKRIKSKDKFIFCSHKCKGKWQTKYLLSEKHPSWKGGKWIDKLGYIYVSARNHPNKVHNGYIFEHRLVVEKKIGRYLRQDEHIHHLNGIKDDNRPENLAITNNKDHDRMSVRHALQKRIRELEKQLKI